MRFSSDQIQKIGKEISSKVDGKTLFDEFSRGRYSTDASVYQIKPLGVVLPKDTNDVLKLMEYSQKNSIPLLARGGGSSQCGQTVGESVVLDYSKHQNKILELNVEEKYVWVQPGVVLDHLNSFLRPYGLWFPVDVSTSSRATIGGMSANNSCGSRSLYYGNMVHNVLAIEAILDDGSLHTFDQINKNYLTTTNNQDRFYKIIDKFLHLRQKVSKDIDENWPTTQRRVGGYNIDLIDPNGFNSSNLLVGSEGTLSLFNKIKLKLSEIPRNKILGVLNSKDSQMLFLDTPGLQKSNKFLNRIMVQSSMQAISEADVILVMIDGTKKFSEDDLNLFDKIKDKNPIVAINKIDLIKKSRILGLIENLRSKYNFVENFIPISALNNEGTNLLLDKLKENLPFDEKILPDDILTDQPEKFYLSEIIREKIFTNLYQEVPYRIAVVVEEIIEKKKIIVIQAYIVAESSHHKQIIIGKKGQMIKKVGEESRVDIQEFLNCKVFLDLRVKVDSQWLKIKDKAFNYSNI